MRMLSTKTKSSFNFCRLTSALVADSIVIFAHHPVEYFYPAVMMIFQRSTTPFWYWNLIV